MHLLNSAMFKSMAQLSWADVPYKGSGPAMIDMLSGQMDLMFDQLPSSLAQVQAGTAEAGRGHLEQRTSVMPDVPTMAESGLPGFESNSWWAVFAPPKTPPEIVAKLNAAINQALTDPNCWRPSRNGAGTLAEHAGRTGQTARRRTRKWQKVIADNHIEVN